MISRTLRSGLRRTGYVLRHAETDATQHADMEDEFRDLHARCAAFTMTPIERMYALYQAIEYVVAANVPGEIVECGVWRGGSSMLSAMVLARENDRDRRLFLYDTFEGMPEPSSKDVSWNGMHASQQWAGARGESSSEWCYSPLDEVQANLGSTGFPNERLVFVKGKVEETIPRIVPERISLLRLDTDWYESTYHELRHLFPLLSRRGVLLVDDYGYWRSAREAVDQYMEESESHMLLSRIDHSGRIGLKPA